MKCLTVAVALLFAPLLGAQKATLVVCEGLDTDGTTTKQATYAKPINPTNELKPRGNESNVHVVATFDKALGKEHILLFSITDASGTEVAGKEVYATGEFTWTMGSFTVPMEGEYVMKLLIKESKAVLGEAKFKVLPDTSGPKANGDQPSGQGFLWICKTVDDDWNPVGATGDPKSKEKEKIFTWQADSGFNILIKNKPKTPFGTLFLGIVIHKQGQDGKDTDFVNEWQSDQLEENKTTMWCTVEPLTKLPAGRYTVYVIDWYTRETLEHRGNLKQYFAKVTLIVK